MTSMFSVSFLSLLSSVIMVSSGLGAADDDLAAAHGVQVKGVHRLAHFQHDIVGNIDNVVDRTNARLVQRFTHPQGRGSILMSLTTAAQ